MAATPTRKKIPPSDQKNPEEKPYGDRMKKPGNEIDEIFGGKKAKKRNEEDQQKPLDGGSKPKKKVNKIRESDEVFKKKKKKRGPEVDETHDGRTRRRRTADGLTIYSAEELCIGKQDAGGTPLCPFDCSCCF